MKRIIQIILAVVIVALVYVIYDQISTPIRFDNELAARKAQVIERIKDIRTAQRAYKSKYQRFTGDFDTLTAFILNDTLELERKIVDEDDSVGMAALKKAGKKNIEKFKIAVIDTIFAPKVLSKSDIEQLRYIPGTDNQAQYIMEAGIITTESRSSFPSWSAALLTRFSSTRSLIARSSSTWSTTRSTTSTVIRASSSVRWKPATMKQATGSRTPRLTNKVSIQRSLDGHSFRSRGSTATSRARR